MNVEIGAEAALFPEKEYISGIFIAVCVGNRVKWLLLRAGERRWSADADAATRLHWYWRGQNQHGGHDSPTPGGPKGFYYFL